MPSRQPDGTGAKESSPTKGGSLESRRNDLLEGKADPSRVETVQNSLEPFLPRWENPKAGSLLKPKREARAEPALRNESPDIHVHIGRIEVNAVTPLPAPKNRKEPAVKPMSLEEYAQYRRRRPS